MAEAGLGLVSMLLAMTPDDAKNHVLAEIGALLKETEDAKAELQKQRDDFAAEREQARQDRMAAEAGKAEVEMRESEWAKANDGLASAIKTHSAEVEAFGKMREKIDADHADREQKVAARETDMDDRAQAQQALQENLDAREDMIKQREDAVARKHAALTQAMAA